MVQRTKSLARSRTIRDMLHKTSFVFLLTLSFVLMILARTGHPAITHLRTELREISAPLISALNQPVEITRSILANLSDLANLRAENQRLLQENAELQLLRQRSLLLETENAQLVALLNYQPDFTYSFITVRVIADNSGPFVHALTIHHGSNDGVRDGQPVLGRFGLVGRVVETGETQARVLLLTDLNARIPVVIRDNRQRAILQGDNTLLPQLIHTDYPDELEEGSLVMTSGHGGMFPPGLPIGRLTLSEGEEWRVVPLEDTSRLDYVRIINLEHREDNREWRVIEEYQ